MTEDRVEGLLQVQTKHTRNARDLNCTTGSSSSCRSSKRTWHVCII